MNDHDPESAAQRPPPIPVLCVDDNDWIGEAVMRLLRRQERFAWKGWLPSEEGVWERLRSEDPLALAILLLDVDLPGHDSFELLQRMGEEFPSLRVVMLSGHLQPQLVDRAIEAGAWGYISKSDDTGAILESLSEVADGRVTFSPAIQELLQRQG